MILTIQILKFRRNKAYLVGVLYLMIIANFQGHMMLSMELCLYQAVVIEEKKNQEHRAGVSKLFWFRPECGPCCLLLELLDSATTA